MEVGYRDLCFCYKRNFKHAAMLRLSEAKYISKNDTILIIEKYFNRASFFKLLLHKLTVTSNTKLDVFLWRHIFF